MRVIFAGTPEFARSALAALHAAGHNIVGMKLQASAVKQFAQTHQLPVLQPHSLRLDGKYPEEALAAQQFIAQAQADVMVVAAYGLILPQWVLDAPRFGCLNIHGSLLPRWRGAAPIHRAIEAGDVETGITIMQMDAGLDTGDMLLKETWPIGPLDTTATLHDALASMGAQMIVKALSQVGQFTPVKQPEEGVTYAHKIEKSEAALDWTQSAEVLARRVRAFDPFPGMSTQLGDEVIKIWQAHALNANASANPQHAPLAGTILAIAETGIQVACGEGVLCLTQLQKPGGKRQPVSDFVRSFKGAVGDVFKA